MLRKVLAGFVVLLIAATCIQLGRWQFHRSEVRKAWNAQVEQYLSTTPVNAEDLLGSVTSTAEVEWRPVSFIGRFDTDQQLLIRGRYFNGQYGYEVITPLINEDGNALLVDRGWIPAGASATTVPTIPAPPSGVVHVIGRVRSGDDINRPGPNGAIIGLPTRAANRIDPMKIAQTLPYPALPGYIEMTAPRTQLPVNVPPPELSAGPHLAYAIQWFFFAGLALIAPFFYRRIGSPS